MKPGDFVQTPDGPGVIVMVNSSKESAVVKLDGGGDTRSYPLSQLTVTESGTPPTVAH